MVKIVNTAGDIKTGVQGRVVYQRKYGQQIRRMREPKRAIASEAQIRHRQLYRAALDWRKTLSLANRRSLDGYAIANWIVDDHKIPLPWHRFALKLYLEHVHFTLLSKPTAPETGPWQKFESYETGDNTESVVMYDYRQGETFTPLLSHTLDRIDLKLRRKGSGGGPVALVLTNTDVDHKPTGSPLFTQLFPVTSVPEASAAWWPITCPPTPLAAGKEYGLYIYLTNYSYNNYMSIRIDTTTASYPRGVNIESTDGGISWTVNTTYDKVFKEYGTLAGTPAQPGELEIRHPALKNITRKNNGLISQQWENMSSLDEGRLFDHLKLAVDAGDLIEATTIADLTSTYQL